MFKLTVPRKCFMTQRGVVGANSSFRVPLGKDFRYEWKAMRFMVSAKRCSCGCNSLSNGRKDGASCGVRPSELKYPSLRSSGIQFFMFLSRGT